MIPPNSDAKKQNIQAGIVRLYKYNLEVEMSNNPYIIFTIECNAILGYIWRVPPCTCSPPNKYC
jgi:hypothetical protein